MEDTEVDVGYKLKELKYSNRKTLSLILDHTSYQKVEHLFYDDGRPKILVGCEFSFKGYLWTLYMRKMFKDATKQKPLYKIYGVCGDSTFGELPWYYSDSRCGNIRAARYCLNKFLERWII